MKKLLTAILVLAVFLTGTALAEATHSAHELHYTEKVQYKGEGVFEIEFMRDVAWREGWLLTATDDQGISLTADILGGDANGVFVRISGEVRPDSLYTFRLISETDVLPAIGQSTLNLTYKNYCEYCLAFGHDEKECAERQAAGVYEADRCDLCGELNHDEDHCPDRRAGELYCDHCARYGHDDDFCPYDNGEDYCDVCREWGHDDDRCPNRTVRTQQPAAAQKPQTAKPAATPRPEYCDDCGETGHDDDRCPNERCDECGETGHDDDRCPNRTVRTQQPAAAQKPQTAKPSATPRPEYCDDCGEYGHDDDDCPNERCDDCGETGHDDDRCPNERCDECGETGHDDDRCPNERCDECGETGHDDDRCPNERCDECGETGHDDDYHDRDDD